jgi:hypothetical protein
MCNRRRAREWRVKFPERVAENARAARARITEEARERTLKRNARRNLEYRMAALRHYGGEQPSCACCGESNWRFLAFDHINGGGGQHRREIGAVNMVNWLVRNGFPKGFQLLCHNCNFTRGCYGFCPHELSPDTLAADLLLVHELPNPRRIPGRPPLVS